ncbi:uncharacterized protein LOC143021768 isoform X3 [Oratosquilla oratoria]|uniref:uncharacterized protein LOC143021768 isoform X3 n=1 Tax=Oratosquilla oratoria TaxID=337810 RepID=UPI003F75BD01
MSCENNGEHLELRSPATAGNGDKKTDNGLTFLHIAAGIDDEDEAYSVVSDLLAHGAEPNVQDAGGRTSLHVAASMGHLKVVDLLLLNGGDPLLSDKAGYSALDSAFGCKQVDTLRYLSQLLDEEDYDAQKQEMKKFKLEFIGEEVVHVPVFTTFPSKHSSSLPSPFMTTFSDSDETNCIESFLTDDDENSLKDCLNNYKIFMKTRNTSSLDGKKESDIVAEQLQNVVEVEMMPTKAPAATESAGDKMDTFHNKTETSFLDQAILFSGSEMESWVTAASTVESMAEEYLYTDEEKDIVLLERRCEPLSSLTRKVEESFEYHVNSNIKPVIRSSDNRLMEKAKFEETQDSIGSLTESIALMDSGQLMEDLKALGVSPGPITSTTMVVYQRHLMRLRKNPTRNVSPEKPVSANYPRELQKTLQDIKYLDLDEVGSLEDEMKEPFLQPDKSRYWRDGTCKRCFNYLLLDPRITHEFTSRASMLSEEEKFELFISSIFYIGKGSQGRPYSHLYEAITTKEMANKKLEKIQEIWTSGFGVVSLHVFHNTIPVEAWTREAVMISAIGLQNLFNCVQGTFYGPASTWRNRARRLLGIYLLHKAMNILILEGETQIRPAEVCIPKWKNKGRKSRQ